MATVVTVIGVGLCAMAVSALAYGLYDLAQVIREIHKHTDK